MLRKVVEILTVRKINYRFGQGNYDRSAISSAFARLLCSKDICSSRSERRNLYRHLLILRCKVCCCCFRVKNCSFHINSISNRNSLRGYVCRVIAYCNSIVRCCHNIEAVNRRARRDFAQSNVVQSK